MTIVTFGNAREGIFPLDGKEPEEILYIPWRTDDGKNGTIKIAKEGYSNVKAIEMVKALLEAPHYQDVGKEFELE